MSNVDSAKLGDLNHWRQANPRCRKRVSDGCKHCGTSVERKLLCASTAFIIRPRPSPRRPQSRPGHLCRQS